uniref:Uncharacterized protein n=1 Tax=Globisporangium ultimum (strain ATCC 200006 / CBS 805.95 / DAOM BR144) TaxID=431595 RepID=K3WUG5_GLOUD
MAATRGLEKLQHATHELFAIADTPVELSNLKKVWGLRSADESDDDGNASREEANEARAQRLLQSVEDLDTALNHELAYFALRIEDAMQQLQQFQTLLQRQIDEKKQFEEKSRPPQVAVTEDAVDVMQQQQNAIAHPPPPVADDDEPPVAAQEHVTTVFASPEQTQHLHHTSVLPEPLMPAGIVLLPGAIATNDQEDDETSSSAKKDE